MTYQQTWDERTQRCITLRSGQGRPLKVVREVYIRTDILCHSPLCLAGCNNEKDEVQLPREVTHYIIPDCQTAKDFLELFELPEIQGVVFTQTAAHCVLHEGSHRLSTRLRHLVQTPGAGAVLFCNEFQKYAHCLQEDSESVADWQIRSTFRAAEWLYDHLAGQIPVVMLTDNEQALDLYGTEKMGVLVLTLSQYLKMFCEGQDRVMEVYHSLSVAASTQKEGKKFTGYFSPEVLKEGLKTGHFVSGRLNVNRFNALAEAFVARSGTDLTEDSGSDILIIGIKDRNRAVHGDEVVVKLYPKQQWHVRSEAVRIAEENEDDDVDANLDGSQSGEARLPTGHVVGILQHRWRDCVGSLSSDEIIPRNSNKSGKVLVIPWDYRIPKIRIATRQVETLRDQRFVVRIDNWPSDSQYPNGHLVRILGPIGDLETEISALLTENEISTSSFTPAQLAELPADSAEEPWIMSEEEVRARRDLRQTHLVFSIDPKGCEDVDDTLSIRELENGNLELGVHIADVTFFVQPGSLTDREAQNRSTTVYLADRRYDMLPAVLSANLCSLISGNDRYAMSVIWELTPHFEVLNVWYGRTIIHSQYKLFYEMAQKICDGCSDKETVENVPELQNLRGDELTFRLAQLRWSLRKLTELGRSLKSRRTQCGALELESVEVQVQLTETKKIEDLTPKEHLEVHETIAECMIFANHWVAKKIAQAFPSKALLRNHPPPKQDQFENLQKCAGARGFHIDTSSNKALATSLDHCSDLNDPVVNSLMRMLATLAMSNARYFCTGSKLPDEFGHYGLALDLYTHFTSPIRRYADIIVHRLLLAAVRKEKEGTAAKVEDGLMGSKQLEELTEHMNVKHKAAQNAQRDSQELFQTLFFRDHEDDLSICTADAVIYQLRANGVMVYVPRYGVKGIVYLQDRSGNVLYLVSSNQPQFVVGSLARTDNTLTVTCSSGSQCYHLLEHITVRISVSSSHAHCQSLKMDVVAKQSVKHSFGQSEDVTSQADIVKMVKKGAEDTRVVDAGSMLDSLSSDMRQFRQSQNSLYLFFQSMHDLGLKSV